MAYLIDGNNFIGHLSALALRDPRSKHLLISRLRKFQKQKRTRILVVFDGPPDTGLVGEHLQEKNFSVIFPAPEQNADKIIKEIISKETDLRRFFVVSSDREIRNFAKSEGAKPLSCKEFNRKLKSALKEHRDQIEEEKRQDTPSSLEVKQWLKIFKDKK